MSILNSVTFVKPDSFVRMSFKCTSHNLMSASLPSTTMVPITLASLYWSSIVSVSESGSNTDVTLRTLQFWGCTLSAVVCELTEQDCHPCSLCKRGGYSFFLPCRAPPSYRTVWCSSLIVSCTPCPLCCIALSLMFWTFSALSSTHSSMSMGPKSLYTHPLFKICKGVVGSHPCFSLNGFRPVDLFGMHRIK